jgi:acyl-CoA thioesterase YciA
MIFRTRKLIRPEHLNSRGTLFGGIVMKWIDEEAAIYSSCQLETSNLVTKVISELDFVSPAKNGDIVEIGTEVTTIGRTSITLSMEVRNKTSKETIVKVDKLVFVHVDEHGKPAPHGVTLAKEG